MKKLILGLVALMALTFVACDDNDDETLYTVDFEDIALDSAGYWNGADGSSMITNNDASFTNTFTNWGGGATSWSGFAISNNADIETEGYMNQYSCFAGSGANTSSQFALFFPGWGVEDSITFDTPIDLESIMVCNSTYAALSMIKGDAMARSFTTDSSDYFMLTIELYNEAGTQLGSEDFYLADFRNGKETIINEWKKIDLSTFKEVSYVKFDLQSTVTYTPTYFCLDNIKYYTAE